MKKELKKEFMAKPILQALVHKSLSPKPKPERCLKCYGYGHFFEECPNDKAVALEEFEQCFEEEVKEESHEVSTSIPIEEEREIKKEVEDAKDEKDTLFFHNEFLETRTDVPIEDATLSPLFPDEPSIDPFSHNLTQLPLTQNWEGCEEPLTMSEIREKSETTREEEECTPTTLFEQFWKFSPPPTLDPSPTCTFDLETTFENVSDERNFENGAIVFQNERPVALLNEKQLSSFATSVRTFEPHHYPITFPTQTHLVFPFTIRDGIHESKSSKGLSFIGEGEEKDKTIPSTSIVEFAFLDSLHNARYFGHNVFIRKGIHAIQKPLESPQNFQQLSSCEHFQIHEASSSKMDLTLLMHDSMERYQKELKQRCSEFLENQKGDRLNFVVKILCSHDEHLLNMQCELELFHLSNALVDAISYFPFDPGLAHNITSMNAREHHGSYQWKIFDPGLNYDRVHPVLFLVPCYVVSPSLRTNSFKEEENDVEWDPPALLKGPVDAFAPIQGNRLVFLHGLKPKLYKMMEL